MRCHEHDVPDVYVPIVVEVVVSIPALAAPAVGQPHDVCYLH